jgi:hypothetical protein
MEVLSRHYYSSQVENARDVVNLRDEVWSYYGTEISLEHFTPATDTEAWDFVAVDDVDEDEDHVSMEAVLTGRPHGSMLVLEGFIDIQTVDAIDPSLLDLGTNVLCRHWHREQFPERMSVQLATDLWEFLRHESSERSRGNTFFDVFRPESDWSGTFAAVDLGGAGNWNWNWIRFVAPSTIDFAKTGVFIPQGCLSSLVINITMPRKVFALVQAVRFTGRDVYCPGP